MVAQVTLIWLKHNTMIITWKTKIRSLEGRDGMYNLPLISYNVKKSWNLLFFFVSLHFIESHSSLGKRLGACSSYSPVSHAKLTKNFFQVISYLWQMDLLWNFSTASCHTQVQKCHHMYKPTGWRSRCLTDIFLTIFRFSLQVISPWQ